MNHSKLNNMQHLGLVQRDESALLVIDIQERLMPVISESDSLYENVNRLISGMKALNVPILVTEQYPKGLGNTSVEVQLPDQQKIVEKVCFSCVLVDEVMQWLKENGVKSVVLCGVETHICVLKTALDALAEGLEVHVVADAVSSRTRQNWQLALDRMRHAGAFISSTEMILFQLMDKAGSSEFKQISKIIK